MCFRWLRVPLVCWKKAWRDENLFYLLNHWNKTPWFFFQTNIFFNWIFNISFWFRVFLKDYILYNWIIINHLIITYSYMIHLWLERLRWEMGEDYWIFEVGRLIHTLFPMSWCFREWNIFWDTNWEPLVAQNGSFNSTLICLLGIIWDCFIIQNRPVVFWVVTIFLHCHSYAECIACWTNITWTSYARQYLVALIFTFIIIRHHTFSFIDHFSCLQYNLVWIQHDEKCGVMRVKTN